VGHEVVGEVLRERFKNGSESSRADKSDRLIFLRSRDCSEYRRTSRYRAGPPPWARRYRSPRLSITCVRVTTLLHPATSLIQVCCLYCTSPHICLRSPSCPNARPRNDRHIDSLSHDCSYFFFLLIEVSRDPSFVGTREISVAVFGSIEGKVGKFCLESNS